MGRRALMIEANGICLSLDEWARRTGLCKETIRQRLNTGSFTPEEAVGAVPYTPRKSGRFELAKTGAEPPVDLVPVFVSFGRTSTPGVRYYDSWPCTPNPRCPYTKKVNECAPDLPADAVRVVFYNVDKQQVYDPRDPSAKDRPLRPQWARGRKPASSTHTSHGGGE